MTTKTVVILLLSFIAIGKYFAQTNIEEALTTYQLAQEEYDKAHYPKAIEYLDKVEKLNPEAKVKSSYLKAKCYESELFKTSTGYNAYFDCIKTISYYMNNGKDEGKKEELLKLKLKIENDETYNLFVSVNKMTLQEAYSYITDVVFGSTKFKGHTEYSGLAWTSKFVDNCTLEFITMKLRGHLDYSNLVTIYKINFSQCTVKNSDEIDFSSCSIVYNDYYSFGKYEKHFNNDLENFNKGELKTHSNSKRFVVQNGIHFQLTDFFKERFDITKKDMLMLYKAFELVSKACKK